MPLEFDPATHSYALDGVAVPSVTQILSDMGCVPWYPDKELYRARGTAVHKACALLVSGKLDLKTTDIRLHGYIESFSKFMIRTGFKPQLIEHPVWSQSYLAAGTLDYMGPLNGSLAVIDLKSGDPASASALQTAAYAFMLKECGGITVQRRLTLRLDPDGGDPRPEEYHDMSSDVRTFLSASAVWHWRKRHGLVK